MQILVCPFLGEENNASYGLSYLLLNYRKLHGK